MGIWLSWLWQWDGTCFGNKDPIQRSSWRLVRSTAHGKERIVRSGLLLCPSSHVTPFWGDRRKHWGVSSPTFSPCAQTLGPVSQTGLGAVSLHASASSC